MLIELTMKCFRKHEDRTINFTRGLNAIRGANEAGKTTMQIALMYALFGVKALPLPLEDMVTWGRPVKDLRVQATVRIYGELYLFERHKNGAECRFNGETVTGQNEVTAFASKLLGADLKLAQKLMFAGQGDLRGALDSGATALSGYIEDLSGMDLFDVLMDLISDKLATGPTSALDNAVAALEAVVEQGAPTAPDTSATASQMETTKADISHYTARVTDLTADAAAATDRLNHARTEVQVQATMRDNLARVLQTHQQRSDMLQAIEAKASHVVDADRIAELRVQIAEEGTAKARSTAYRAFMALLPPDPEWEGDAASLGAEIAETRKKREVAQTKMNGLHANIREANAKKVTSSLCGFCQQDLSQFPEVAKRNAELQAQVEAWMIEKRGCEETIFAADDDLKALLGVEAAAAPYNTFLRSYSALVEVDEGFVPPHISWKGAIPAAGQDVAALEADLRRLTAEETAVATAKAKLEGLRETLEQDSAEVQRLRAELSARGAVVELVGLEQAKSMADSLVGDTTRHIQRLQGELANLVSVIDRASIEFGMKQKAFNEAEAQLKGKRAERDALVFNNTLVKKVRQARPIVAAKLWTVVLASVSTMFTKMRGEASVVTKEKDEFRVNGKPAKAISGSGLDLLGLAIRVALVKSFIPACSFMLMDEAMAACDDNRTASMLGFIGAAGLDQVLLITHEEVSSSAADHLIVI